MEHHIMNGFLDFQAQTPMELSLVKGEMVTLTRRIDGNWLVLNLLNKDKRTFQYFIKWPHAFMYVAFRLLPMSFRYEGRIGARRGIFPATYVDVSVEPGETRSNTGI